MTRPGARLSVVLGEAFGAVSPVALTSPMFLVDVRLDAGATLDVDIAYASARPTCSRARSSPATSPPPRPRST